MLRVGPHPQALFSLVPRNDRAQETLQHRENAHLVSSFRPYKDDPTVEEEGLEVGFHIRSASRYTLATIGREGDIVVDHPAISRQHCSFEIHEGNKEEIMLQDRSLNRSTELFGLTKEPFEPGRPHRRVIVDQKINLEFGIGGPAGDLYQFEIFWHKHDKSMISQQIDRREDNPRQARTIADEPPAIVPSFPTTRIHGPGSSKRMRYSKRGWIGEGAYGVVFKVANVDTGEHLALRHMRIPGIQSYEFAQLKREVNMLTRVSHTNIIKLIWHQRTDNDDFEIFMELKPGSVQCLVDKHVFENEPALAKPLLHQMLQALDHLDDKKIIHRDVKPENILYTPLPDGQYLYQLTDFGLANIVAKARTPAGSDIYMAPELCGKPGPQTTKVDIWSLFVTLAYALDADGFREKVQDCYELRIEAVREAANSQGFRSLRPMAIEDPNDRATAGDMLDKIFGGEGRTTARNRVG